MPQIPGNLDRLNDIVLPPQLSWWPLAPGWYVLIAISSVTAGWLMFRLVKNWKANAYRRVALRELATLNDASSIAELLRRTALVVSPRADVASLSENEWVDWLANHSSVAVPPEVRRQLSCGVYEREPDPSEVSALCDFAAQWISQHPTMTVES